MGSSLQLIPAISFAASICVVALRKRTQREHLLQAGKSRLPSRIGTRLRSRDAFLSQLRIYGRERKSSPDDREVRVVAVRTRSLGGRAAALTVCRQYCGTFGCRIPSPRAQRKSSAALRSRLAAGS